MSCGQITQPPSPATSPTGSPQEPQKQHVPAHEQRRQDRTRDQITQNHPVQPHRSEHDKLRRRITNEQHRVTLTNAFSKPHFQESANVHAARAIEPGALV